MVYAIEMRVACFVAPLVVICTAAFACAPTEDDSASDGLDVRRKRGSAGTKSGEDGGSGGAGSTAGKGGAGGSSGAGAGTSSGKGGASGNGGGGTAGTGSNAKGGTGGTGGNAAGTGGTQSGKGGSAGQPPVGGSAGSSTGPTTCAECPLGATCTGGACVCPPGLVLEADGCKQSCAGGEACPPFSACGGGVCRCNAGAVVAGAGCWPEAPGEPTSHSEADVCAVYKWGQTSVQDANPVWTKGPTECDGGTLPGWVRHDVTNRVSMYRWLAGLAPSIINVQLEQRSMACAAAASWNVQFGHNIPASAKCYTPEGAQGAASSNIAWGNTSTGAIDAWVDDRYDITNTFGHRFSVLSEGSTSFGFGHYAGGGSYGSASCLAGGFGGFTGPFPPAGIVPAGVATMPWTIGGVSAPEGAVPTVTEKASGKSLEVAIGKLGSLGGFSGPPKIYLERKGWEPQAGVTYVVSITGASAPVAYEMQVVGCP